MAESKPILTKVTIEMDDETLYYIDSPEPMPVLLQALTVEQGVFTGFKDVDGSVELLYTRSIQHIRLTPQGG